MMTFLRTTALTTALAVMAGPALADISADEVWSNWQELIANFGMELDVADESSGGGQVVLSGAVLTFEMPEGRFSMDMGDITFAETGDGTVSVTMSDEMPIGMMVDDPEAGEVNVSMSLKQPGAELIVSGDAAAPRYDFAYPVVSLTDFDIVGEEVPEDFPLVMDIAANNVAGFMALEDGPATPYTNAMSMETVVADIRIDVPESEGGGAFNMNFSLADLAQTTNGSFGTVAMDMSLSEMIGGGMRQEGQATHGAAQYTVDVNGPDGAFTMQGTAASGSFFANITEGGISYGATSNDATLSLAGDQIPLPVVNLAMAESGGTLTLPVVPGDEPQDFGVGLRLVGLEIDDMIWGLFDPAGQLPRDPATLILDLAGKAIVNQDISDPDFANNPTPSMPGTLEALTVNALQLTVAGAELTGTGDFAFDNSAGIPMPAGKANLMLTGANTLMDTLVGMGLLPEEQAMGARMMMGMFARPGPGEDTLTSEIEMTPDGQILANGQRIR